SKRIVGPPGGPGCSTEIEVLQRRAPHSRRKSFLAAAAKENPMRPFLVALVLLLVPGPAQATTALRLGPRDLAARARAIVEGRVISTDSERTPDGKRIFTRVRIRVDEVWKGSPGREVEVVLPGGVVGDYEQIVQGMPRFGEDESVLVFLEDAPASTAYRVVG